MTQEKLYEGKAKIIYKTPNSEELIQYFKDDATAFNNQKKSSLASKGILNNYISAFIMQIMSEANIPNHFIKRIDNRRQLIKNLKIIPLEVIVRNIAAGSFCKRLAYPEGKLLPKTLIEFCLKDDALGDPIITEDHIEILAIAEIAEIALIKEITLKINKILTNLFLDAGIKLIDFKIEFGRNQNGDIFLADEISPDSCRLWDNISNEKMDKDRFRLDLGDVIEYYKLIAKKLNITNIDYA
jgi:phosphoribosylaminoimidazole-succinocarboxamide synthase